MNRCCSQPQCSISRDDRRRTVDDDATVQRRAIRRPCKQHSSQKADESCTDRRGQTATARAETQLVSALGDSEDERLLRRQLEGAHARYRRTSRGRPDARAATTSAERRSPDPQEPLTGKSMSGASFVQPVGSSAVRALWCDQNLARCLDAHHSCLLAGDSTAPVHEAPARAVRCHRADDPTKVVRHVGSKRC